MTKTIGIPGILFLLACLFACNSSPAPEETESGPVEWVNYPGKTGAGKGKRIVLVSGDEEYRSEEALPQLARILAGRHGFDCTVLFAQDPAKPGVINPNFSGNIPGLEALEKADLLVLFTRFRALPDTQMQYFQDYLAKGKPVIAIRTATHAFEFKDSTSRWKHWSNSFSAPNDPWDGGFGRLVLGEKWHTHHGYHKHQSTRGILAPGANEHPIAKGLKDGDIWGPTDVYGVRLPLPGDAFPIILGQVIDRAGDFDENDPFFGMKPTDTEIATVNPAEKTPYNPNDPMMPIAWLNTYRLPDGKTGRSFTSTIGSSTDMANAGVRRLLVNAAYFLLNMPQPETVDVDTVGNYQPSAYSFQTDEYWVGKGLRVRDFLE